MSEDKKYNISLTAHQIRCTIAALWAGEDEFAGVDDTTKTWGEIRVEMEKQLHEQERGDKKQD